MINLNFLFTRSKKERILGFIAVLFVLSAMGDYFLFQPIKNSINKTTNDISIYEKKIAKNMRVLEIEDEVMITSINTITPVKMTGSNEEEIAKFLNLIEVLSRESYVSLIDMKPRVSRSGSTSFYKKYVVEAEIEGPIDKINLFLYNLQSTPQLLRIEKFTLNKKGETKSEIISGLLTITKIVIIS